MKLNLILLPQLLCAIHEVAGGLRLSTSMAQRTQKGYFIAFVFHKVV